MQHLPGESFLSSPTPNSAEPWLTPIAARQQVAAELLAPSQDQQLHAGYFHTLREILQQPATWLATGRQLAALAGSLRENLAGLRTLILTGSGSSEYAADCVRLPLQNRLGLPVQVLGGGTLLTHAGRAILPGRPALMVSFARSGDSPESVGAVSLLLETEPEIRHLVLTCNKDGRLATTWPNDPRVRSVVLDPRTNDRSLVMTSSYTNMVLAAHALGLLAAPQSIVELSENLSRAAASLFLEHFDSLAAFGRSGFQRIVYLASGAGLGAARESALKMLEMTAGRVWSMHESYLGLRHGPMSAVHADTLIVCFLSTDPLIRAYECDLIRELDRKQLGQAKIIFGASIPAGLARPGDLLIDCPGLAAVGDDAAPILDILIGQLLGLFRSMQEGLQPDAPSTTGVISRVVGTFQLHR
jgi:tagatose-6-phosphate ketose/aldose isomerase